MTQAILCNNEKLAEFMGLKSYNFFDLKFHNSWDQLMPIVEKLDLIDGYTCISIDHDCVFLHRKGGEMLHFYNVEEGSKIAAVYKAVCTGVEWVTLKAKTKI